MRGAIRLLFVLAVVCWPVGAWAYIDPGSGLLLVQGVISAVIGAIFIARRTLAQGLARVAAALGLRSAASGVGTKSEDGAAQAGEPTDPASR
jgi:hypothetical protein